MRNIVTNLGAALFLTSVTLLISPPSARAATSATSERPPAAFTQKEIEKLAEPIALYPDLLLQQVLAASTFPEQILDAALYNEQGKAPESIKDQPWDDSVKAVANYPSVLTKMAGDLDWTISLGTAFINQNEDLRKALQALRSRAKSVGNLADSEQQHVIQEKNASGDTIIRIEPADPQVVYIPTTTTTVVYQQPVQTTNLWAPVASFGLGMALGYAMGDDDDHYYYGGGFYGPGFWHGGGAMDNWVDYRRDRWDDAYDMGRDRQEWKQNNRDDWREYRQDLGRKQQEWRQETKNRAGRLGPEERAKATSRANTSRASWQAKTPDQRKQAVQNKTVQNSGVKRENLNKDALQQRTANKGTFSKAGSANYGSINRNDASQRLNQARSNPQLQQRATQYRSSPAVQQRQQSLSSRSSSQLSQRSMSSYERGGGLSGINGSRSSVSRTQARGTASRSFASRGGSRGGGGFSRGGGGRRR